MDRWLIAMGFMLASFGSAIAEDSPGLRRFRDEYPAAFQKLDRVYSHLRIRFIARAIDVQGQEPKRISEMECAREGDLIRVVTHHRKNPQNAVGKSVAVAHPEMSFRLRRQTADHDYEIRGVEAYEELKEGIRLDCRPLFAPTSYFEEPLDQFLASADVRIVDAREDSERPGHVRIDWEMFSETRVKQQGWFLFNADQSWALREYWNRRDMSADSDEVGSFVHGVIEYDGSFEGCPLVKSCRQWVVFHGERYTKVKRDIPVQIEEFDVVEVRVEPSPVTDFTLAAFGLPNPGEVRPANTFWIWVINVIAMALMAGMILLRRRSRSRAEQAA